MIRRRRHAAPLTPPGNVRLVYADGHVIALELVHVGVNTDGLHVWTTPTPLARRHSDAIDAGQAAVLMDVLPARTAVDIRFQPREEADR